MLLLVVSFGVFVSAIVLDQAVRWSNPIDGAINGIFQTIVTGFAWLLYVLPLTLFIHLLFRRRRWERYRMLALLAPAIACVLLVLVGFVISPPTASHRFHQFTGVRLPSSAREVRAHFTGGGLADFGDTYYFRCSASETDRLISTLGLKPADQYDQNWIASAPFKGWPDPSIWKGRTVYRGHRDDWSYYLATDASRQQVYLLVFCF
jgi:hypothetical protein